MVTTFPMVALGDPASRSRFAIGFSILIHVAVAWYFISRLIVAPVFEEPPAIKAEIQPLPTLKPTPPPPQAKADPPKSPRIKPRPAVQQDVSTTVPPLPLDAQPPSDAELEVLTQPQTVPAAAPRPSSKVQPVYPARALDGDIKGVAVVQVTIAASGAVTDAAIVSEAPAGYGFGQAARSAVAKWEFLGSAPGTYTVTVKFAPSPN